MSVEQEKNYLGVYSLPSLEVSSKTDTPTETFYSSIIRERLTRFQEALRISDIPEETRFSIRQICQFFQEVNHRDDVKYSDYPRQMTVEKLIKIAAILGDFPLPPRAIRTDSGGRWHYSLTKKDLATILDIDLKILGERNASVQKVFHETKQLLANESKRRKNLKTLWEEIFPRLGYTEIKDRKHKAAARQILIKGLEECRAPLPADVRPQEILVLGVPLENRQDYITSWTEFIREEVRTIEKSKPFYIMRNWPSVTDVLREALGEKAKIDNRFVYYAVAWLRTQSFPIETVERNLRGRPALYHRLPPDQRDKLFSFLQDRGNRKKLATILAKGFNLEEFISYKKYFPENFGLPISELERLVTGRRNWPATEQRNQIIAALNEANIPIVKEVTQKGILLYKIPISQFEIAVVALKKL